MKVDCAATCGYCGTDMLENINDSVISKACKKKQNKRWYDFSASSFCASPLIKAYHLYNWCNGIFNTQSSSRGGHLLNLDFIKSPSTLSEGVSEIYTLLRKYVNSGEERSIFYKEQVLRHKTLPVTCSIAFKLKSLKFSKTSIFNYLLLIWCCCMFL